RPPPPTLFPYTTLFRSSSRASASRRAWVQRGCRAASIVDTCELTIRSRRRWNAPPRVSGTGLVPYHEHTTTVPPKATDPSAWSRSEEHTSELQSRGHLV